MRKTTQGTEIAAPIRSIISIVKSSKCESLLVLSKEAIVRFVNAKVRFGGAIVRLVLGNDGLRNVIISL
jgi:hypothetical protein